MNLELLIEGEVEFLKTIEVGKSFRKELHSFDCYSFPYMSRRKINLERFEVFEIS